MPKVVVHGAALKCSFGVAPSALVVLPTNQTTVSGLPAATIMDSKPMVNVMPFGTCTTQSNPAVPAATAAALGVPTPAPCVPATASPWAPGSAKASAPSGPLLTDACTCNCSYGGVIQVTFAGQAIAEA